MWSDVLKTWQHFPSSAFAAHLTVALIFPLQVSTCEWSVCMNICLSLVSLYSLHQSPPHCGGNACVPEWSDTGRQSVTLKNNPRKTTSQQPHLQQGWEASWWSPGGWATCASLASRSCCYMDPNTLAFQSPWLTLGMWNNIYLVQNKPELVCEVEHYIECHFNPHRGFWN